MKNAALFVVAVFLTVPLSGCFGEAGKVVSTLEGTYEFEEFHWPAPIRHDGQGHLIDGVGSAADAAPKMVQSILPYAAMEPIPPPPRVFAPTVAANAKGTLFAAVHDYVLASSDGGITWRVVRDLTSPGYPAVPDRFETLGNAIWVDPTTDRLFSLHFLAGYLGCQVLAFSDDEGKSWTISKTNGYPSSCADARENWAFIHLSTAPRVFTSKHGPQASAQLPGSAPVQTYFCEIEMFAGPKCSMSQDGGDVFLTDGLVAPPDANCWRQTFGRAAGHKDGSLLLPLGVDGLVQSFIGGRNCGKPPRVAVTEDDGRSWQVRSLPNQTFTNQELAPSVTVDADGTAYLSFRGPDHLAYLARSKDKFRTWEGPWRVSPPGHTFAYHTSVIAGDAGRIAVAYLGTSTPQEPGTAPFNAAFATEWHLYVSTSFNALDENLSFVTVQVSPFEDLVELGRAASAGNLGSYIDTSIDADGRIYVTFIDGCNPRNGCTTDTEGAFEAADHEVALAVMDSGPSLRADKGVLTSLGLRHPSEGG